MKASLDRKKKLVQLRHDLKEHTRVVNILVRQKQELINTTNKLNQGIVYIRSQFQQWNNAYGYVQFRLKNYEIMEMAANQRTIDDRQHRPLAACMPGDSVCFPGHHILYP